MRRAFNPICAQERHPFPNELPSHVGLQGQRHTENYVVSIYAPNTFEKEFFEQITKALLEFSFEFIIGADFNATVDYSVDRSGHSENLDQKYTPGALRSMIPGWWIFGIY